jgi:hypothetical protein
MSEVPSQYWEDDCPCAKAGDYQPQCQRAECLEKSELT